MSYTREKNTQILISLLKEHGIKYIVASPGNTNTAFIGSVQSDDYFKIISSVDERSAAYIACGIAAESGEGVVISCTGATASRNYLPGLTEAYYRKLPVIAVTSSQPVENIGHLSAQLLDRTVLPNDVAKISVNLPIVKDADNFWECEVKVNEAILESRRRGGGPVHINLPTTFIKPFDVDTCVPVRKIERVTSEDRFPKLEAKKIGIFIASHKVFSKETESSIEKFCENYNSVVFCDHTSSYHGKYRAHYSLVSGQEFNDINHEKPDILIHLGDISGDYYNLKLSSNCEVWRVSEDGELRDSFRKLKYIFEMSPKSFFKQYNSDSKNENTNLSYYEFCQNRLTSLRLKIPELPFSNLWVASNIAGKLPTNSVIHFGILNSLRSWNFFDLPQNVTSFSNVGGFGIDGNMSSVIGASLVDSGKTYFLVNGDLAFFYDLNVLGNRHIKSNVRILLINNGKGTEFCQYNHHASYFGESTEEFIAAAGHFGNKSEKLVRDFVTTLGFEYISARNKNEFEAKSAKFLSEDKQLKPIVFEVFTDSIDESNALKKILSIDVDKKVVRKNILKNVIGNTVIQKAKTVIGK